MRRDMRRLGNLAMIGSGASTVYSMKHLLDSAAVLGGELESVTVFEKSGRAGYGMPYSPDTTDRHNMSNISSEEIPDLGESFYDFLIRQADGKLEEWAIDRDSLNESEVYCRLALGEYLHSRYQAIKGGLEAVGIRVEERLRSEVEDIRDEPEGDHVILELKGGHGEAFDTVVIATGHAWEDKDDPARGYHASPWPIGKVLPAEGNYHNHRIGTLGASLSAFDVISSLAHRHGKFYKNGHGFIYKPHEGTEEFGLVMHAANGRLPHLQFDQVEPFREVYRHVGRERLLGLADGGGRLRLDCYFDEVCRPALLRAFGKDGLELMVGKLSDGEFGLEDFVEEMTDRHDHGDAFAGMKLEMLEARHSVRSHTPIHWKETLDDLLYCLNYHAELLPAEDHLRLQRVVMPFLMNVIAAMPLPSAHILLALHDAGKLDLVTGYVSRNEGREGDTETLVSVDHEGGTKETRYAMFIDCGGQRPLELEDFPFRSLVESGAVRKARAEFIDPAMAGEAAGERRKSLIFEEAGRTFYHTGGIDIDAGFRVIGGDGESNKRIYDIAFPHTSGVRPYSYGLQACNATSGVMVEGWVRAIREHRAVAGGLEKVSELYEEV